MYVPPVAPPPSSSPYLHRMEQTILPALLFYSIQHLRNHDPTDNPAQCVVIHSSTGSPALPPASHNANPASFKFQTEQVEMAASGTYAIVMRNNAVTRNITRSFLLQANGNRTCCCALYTNRRHADNPKSAPTTYLQQVLMLSTTSALLQLRFGPVFEGQA